MAASKQRRSDGTGVAGSCANCTRVQGQLARKQGELEASRTDVQNLEALLNEHQREPFRRKSEVPANPSRDPAADEKAGVEEGQRVFVDDPCVPPDNNAAQCGLRGPVIGHLTSFGSGSNRGAELTGLLFSVLRRLRPAGLNPHAWILDYPHACAQLRGQAPANLGHWLPWNMDADRQAALRASAVTACEPPATVIVAAEVPLARAG